MGGFMRNNLIKSSDEKTPSQQPEIDSSSRTDTLRQQIIFGIKLAAVGGIFFLLLWLYEKI
jgi:hypothetical protein